MGTRISKPALAVGGLCMMLVSAALLTALSRNNAAPAVTTLAPTAAVIDSAGASIASNRPGWQSIPFVNVRTNQSMTLADFAGKTIVVEVFSVWCSNCTEQQKQSAQALTKLGQAAPVYISLDMDIAHPHDTAQTVADYVAREQFPWVFAISNQQFTDALIDQFGFNILNAPITPIFVISPTGTVSQLYIGNHNADDLITLIQAESKT